MVVGIRAWGLVASALLYACSGDRADSVGDSLGAGDAGARDSALATDAEPVVDEPDAADEADAASDEEDAGEPDAGESDSSELDAGDDSEPDAGDAGGQLPYCDRTTAIVVDVSIALTADNEVDGLFVDGQTLNFSNAGSAWSSVKLATTSLDSYAGAPIVIAAIGRNTSNQAGLDRGLIATIQAGNSTIDTSALWRVSATGEPNWIQPTFDDRSWQAAVALGVNGVAPWGVLSGISADAEWIWSYDPSTAPNRPTEETNYFRYTFAVDTEGDVMTAPSCRAPQNF